MGLSQGTGSRLVTKQNTAGEVLLSATVNTNSGSAGSFGSWVQLTASTSAEYALTAITVYISNSPLAAQYPIYIEVGYGGAGSEVTLGRRNAVFVPQASGPMGGVIPLTVPWRVSAGVRLAARIAFQQATNSAFDLTVSVLPWASLEGN